jgi:hypothetical protein
LNFEKLSRTKIFTNIFSGIAAGIYGLGAFQGILWWMGSNLIVAIFLYARISTMGTDQSGESKYFTELLKTVSANVFSNLMTYMLFWIMFYNVSYIV